MEYAEIASELSANNADEKSIVCLTWERDNIALVPSVHGLICHPCADIMMQNSGMCPICRTAISMIINLYR